LPDKNHDLHGNAPDKSPVALLLIDVINDLEFDTGKQILEFALPMAENIRALKAKAKMAGIPVIYVNDNFGKWRSDFKNLVDHCLDDDVVGKPLVQLLKPDKDDYFVLKPKHSGFFSTTLELLLEYLGAKTLIMTGLQTHICILFTADDAYMRDYHLIVPEDCVCSDSEEKNRLAIEQIRETLKANTAQSTELDLKALVG
jgi:nicotinamidase-related amidase